jgi:hypothetical protein
MSKRKKKKQQQIVSERFGDVLHIVLHALVELLHSGQFGHQENGKFQIEAQFDAMQNLNGKLDAGDAHEHAVPKRHGGHIILKMVVISKNPSA